MNAINPVGRTCAPVPPNGNPGVVPPWLCHPTPPELGDQWWMPDGHAQGPVPVEEPDR